MGWGYEIVLNLMLLLILLLIFYGGLSLENGWGYEMGYHIISLGRNSLYGGLSPENGLGLGNCTQSHVTTHVTTHITTHVLWRIISGEWLGL